MKTDGTLWGWGANNNGRIGDNSTVYRSSPTQIPGTWSSFSSSSYQGFGIKTDGTLWAWGENTKGQLADNTTTERSSPIQIPGTNWKQVYAGLLNSSYNHTSAVKTDGTLWSWGYNKYGALGQNNLTKYSSPVQVPGTDWNVDNNKAGYGAYATAVLKKV